jgi:hypothetical protein
MSGPIKCCALLLVGSLLAGCASTSGRPAPSESAAQPATGAANAGESGDVTALRVIDLNKTVDDSASTVVCRQMLRQNSNVITTNCMTRADWKEFERRQALQAEEFVRRLQNGTYR